MDDCDGLEQIGGVVTPARLVPASAETIQGRWKLMAAEDVRADGSVARYPWGRHPVGSIVVDGGACYVQIMSSDVPVFSDAVQPVREQMRFFRFDGGRLLFGPAPNSIRRGGSEALTRRLTLERATPEAAQK
jgi:hypothetical protein